MATVVTIQVTANADGSLTIVSTDTPGLDIVVVNPKDESQWTTRFLRDFILGTLFP